MTLYTKFVYWYFNRINNYPHPGELAELFEDYLVPEDRWSSRKLTSREHHIMGAYITSWDSPEQAVMIIAKNYNVTRERIRCILSKIRRKLKKGGQRA